METLKISVQTPLRLIKFKINGQEIGPIILKPRERPTIEWEIEGKDVKVSIDYIAKELPAKGQQTLSEFPTSGIFDISLRATDAYGQSIDPKTLKIQIEPSIEPSINSNTTLPTPQLFKNSKQ